MFHSSGCFTFGTQPRMKSTWLQRDVHSRHVPLVPRRKRPAVIAPPTAFPTQAGRRPLPNSGLGVGAGCVCDGCSRSHSALRPCADADFPRRRTSGVSEGSEGVKPLVADAFRFAWPLGENTTPPALGGARGTENGVLPRGLEFGA